MSAFRVLACLFGLMALIAPVHGQPASLWDIDGSTASEERSTTTDLRMVFQTPGGNFAAQGAAPGVPLFEGERDNQTVSGIAWSFSAQCSAESYEVTGSYSADGKTLTLTGRAPVKDAGCRIASFHDQTLVFTKRGAVANAPPPQPQPAAPPPPQPPPVATPAPLSSPGTPGRTYWAHNGSTIYLVPSGSARELYYDAPRSGMAGAGARPGTLLFRGTYAGGTYTGTAYRFHAGCSPQPYPVSGPVTNNFERITMSGQAPVMDSSCNITKYMPDVLVFDLCVKVLPPGATFLVCPL